MSLPPPEPDVMPEETACLARTINPKRRKRRVDYVNTVDKGANIVYSYSCVLTRKEKGVSQEHE